MTSTDKTLIEEIPSHAPIIIWIGEKGAKSKDAINDPIKDNILYELKKHSYLETSIDTISHAHHTNHNEVRSVIASLFLSGFLKQITIYQSGKARQIMYDKNDDNPHYTQTELRVFQTAKPILEKK